ncbi:MAG: hypothetical protein OEO82_00730 [Gammaproteobacteria bacterium]|nr:hypothetical protein [Gammaproteobacteria bacterium]
MKYESAFAYIIYGNSLEHFEEAVLSIGTLRRFGTARPILVLTDRPDQFPRIHGLHTVPLDRPTLDGWIGKSGYHFRVKLEGLCLLLSCYTKKVIFLDTDTLVRRDIDCWFSRINDSTALLHNFEGPLSTGKFCGHFQNVLNRTFSNDAFGQFTIRPTSPMYNSGVIGVAQAHLHCLDAALWLMDEINPRITSHNAEQMALGYMLSRDGRVRTVGDRTVYHYWYRDRGRYVKQQLSDLLQRYSAESIMSDPRLAHQVRQQRNFRLWKQDKLRRLRRKGVIEPLKKWHMRQSWRL